MAVTKPSTADGAWTPPPSFDQFVVERALGGGGMGRVYLGRDVALDRPVALKFISSPYPTAAARSRFLVEARAIARLTHPNVVAVYRVGEVDGQPYIAYEFVAGQSLDKLLKPMSWSTALRLAVGLARGLDAAHRAGVLHRDIKPGNAVLGERGEIKLLDFGLAKLASEDVASSGSVPPSSGAIASSPAPAFAPAFAPAESVSPHADTLKARSLTHPSTLMGTPAYLAPELWLGQVASARSDVFAFGLVLYELLAGKLPHLELETQEMALRVIHEPLPPVRTRRSEVPESFAAIVDRCLRREPLERFASASELLKALEEVQAVFLPASGGITAVQLEPERLLVAESLSRLSSRMRMLTSTLYARLFAVEPGVRGLFPDDLSAQQDKLAHTLRLAIDGMADPERLAPVLEDLGRRHVHYGVSPAHFDLLEQSLLGALAEVDVTDWTPEVERAWKRAFAFIESAMRRGMEAEKKTVASGLALKRARERHVAPEVPRTRYAPSGELHIAYQTVGEGPVDVVLLVGWLSHVEIGWQNDRFARFVQALSRFARVILFDKRGMGMSDRAFESSTIEDRVDDLQAVLDHAGSRRAFLLGVAEGASTAATFAAFRPSRVNGVILYGATARVLEAPDYPHGMPLADVDLAIAAIRERWGEPVFVEAEAPSTGGDSAFREWLALYMRMAASPGTAIHTLKLNARLDLRQVLRRVHVPAVVLHRSGDEVIPIDAGRDLAARIAGARFVALEGADHLPFVGDTAAMLAHIEAFVGESPPPSAGPPTPVSLSLVVAATGRAGFEAACADRAVACGATRVQGGPHSDVDFAFGSAVRAVRCARELLALAAQADVAVRMGVEVGTPAAAAELALTTRPGTVRVGTLVYTLALGADVPLEADGDSYVLQ
jgi:serine/threonine protein kinase/pimeloyl-ACP methyl ester carboxylesterase